MIRNKGREGGAKVVTPRVKVKEVKVFGIQACLSVWRSRPHAIRKAALVQELENEFAECLKDFKKRRVPFRIASVSELERISGSSHNEGVCFLTEAKKKYCEGDLRLIAEKERVILCLDGVGNPHNLGAILRSCAHFGVSAILTGEEHASISGAGGRVAEGAAEFVKHIVAKDLGAAATKLRAFGYRIIVLDGKAKGSLFDENLSGRILLVVGAEDAGVSKSVLDVADKAVKIPGTGKVESLNVSVAAAVALSEYRRQNS